MKVIIQRVKQAEVKINNKTGGKINNGLLLFVGFHKSDKEKDIEKLVNKIINLRIFSDNFDKINLSLKDIEGEILAISQFTLYSKIDGRRPSFTDALEYNAAKKLYNLFVEKLKEYDFKVEQGVFGEDMQVSLINDGPFTIILDSKEL